MYKTTIPKISIITPVLNQVSFIEETILSVISQEYPDLEYIIIDGGSTDGTVEIIRKYEKDVSYWISEPDRGMYHAIQKGFNKSTGEIMAWINSDDKYHPDSLRMVAEVFNDTDVEWITGIPSMYNLTGQCVKQGNLERWSRSRFWIKDYQWIQQENVFWRRSLWQKAGGFMEANLKYAGDFELWCRFFKHSELYSVNTSFAGFRLHSKSQLSILCKMEYESEAEKIVTMLKPLGFSDFARFCLMYLLNFLKIIVFYTYILRFLDPVLKVVINKLHFFPKIIYFDFIELKWTK